MEAQIPGYSNPDDDLETTQAHIENNIKIAQQMLPKGPSAFYCLDCEIEIPQARRKAMVGVKYCIECQTQHDKKPKLKLLTKML